MAVVSQIPRKKRNQTTLFKLQKKSFTGSAGTKEYRNVRIEVDLFLVIAAPQKKKEESQQR